VEGPDREAVGRRQPALFAAPASSRQPAVTVAVMPAAAVPVSFSSATFYAPSPNRQQR
jgi:hypothetical protein